MKVLTCSRPHILQPCQLGKYAYQVDPYIGCEHHCCYCYALNRAETDWKKELLIHADLIGQLEGEISNLEPQPVYMGWNADPYQPSEATCFQTRRVLELLARNGFSVCVLTKSDLVTRDIDFILEMPGSSVGFSIAFHAENTRSLFEYTAPSNARRVTALRTLKEAGVNTYVLVCPIMPFITDVVRCTRMVAPHADMVWYYALSIDAETDRNWKYLCEILERHYPGMKERYQKIVFDSRHPYWEERRQELEAIQKGNGLKMEIRF